MTTYFPPSRIITDRKWAVGDHGCGQSLLLSAGKMPAWGCIIVTFKNHESLSLSAPQLLFSKIIVGLDVRSHLTPEFDRRAYKIV